MKKMMIFAVLAAAVVSLSGAEKFFEMDKKGNLLFNSATLFNFNPASFVRFGGYKMEGKSWLEMELDTKFYKGTNSITVSVTGCLAELPGSLGGTLFVRPGFHNALAIDKHGKAVVSVWFETAPGKYDNIKLVSQRAIRVGNGRYFRAAFSMTPMDGGKTLLKLYLDGAKEAETVIGTPIFGYKRVCYFGGAPSLKPEANLNGIIRSAVIFNEALSDQEIAELR